MYSVPFHVPVQVPAGGEGGGTGGGAGVEVGAGAGTPPEQTGAGPAQAELPPHCAPPQTALPLTQLQEALTEFVVDEQYEEAVPGLLQV